MSIYFCPKCGSAGTKATGRDMCRKCNSGRTKAYKVAARAERPPNTTRADIAVMRGFNPLSQDYLQRKLT